MILSSIQYEKDTIFFFLMSNMKKKNYNCINIKCEHQITIG